MANECLHTHWETLTAHLRPVHCYLSTVIVCSLFNVEFYELTPKHTEHRDTAADFNAVLVFYMWDLHPPQRPTPYYMLFLFLQLVNLQYRKQRMTSPPRERGCLEAILRSQYDRIRIRRQIKNQQMTMPYWKL